MSDKFIRTYGDVEVIFEPEDHQYHVAVGANAPITVPSFSAVAEFLPKYGLPRWYEKEAIKGYQELLRRAIRGEVDNDGLALVDLSRIGSDDPDFTRKLIHETGMGGEAIKDAKASIGTTVHSAFRGWVENGFVPSPADYSGEARGYIESLCMLIADLGDSVDPILCEAPLVSVEHGFAGTPDLFCNLTKPVTLQTGGNRGPKKRPKFTDFPTGSPLLDLKTSAQVFLSHSVQTTAYALMIEELGIGSPTDLWVVLIKPDGAGYNVKSQDRKEATLRACLALWEAEKRPEGWMGSTLAIERNK